MCVLQARAVFHRIDANDNGVLTRAEVIKACRAHADIRTMLGLPTHIRQEDGTRDVFEYGACVP